MLRQRTRPLRLIVAGALVAAGACGEHRQPTAPLVPSNAPSEANAGGGSQVKVKKFQLSSNTLRIDGPGVTAMVEIGNPGVAIQSGISVRGEIAQPAARRRAFDVPTQCLPGDDPGFLSTGTCSMSIPAAASNGGDGVGTFAPGTAEFIVRVLQTTGGTEVELATKSTTVNLVATPSIASFTLASTTLAIDGPGTSWTATLQNPAKSLQGVQLQGYIVQTTRTGTTRRAAGGVQVTCGSAAGVLPPGTCTINFGTSASNAGAGTGTLTPGAATFELNMIQSGNPSTTLDVKTVPITLVSSSPTISSLSLGSGTTLVIGGASVGYTVQLQNAGFPQDWILLQGEIVQGSALTGAGGSYVTCGGNVGDLPTTANCSMQLTVTANGEGLTPGSADFVLHLYKAAPGVDPIEYERRTVPVNLVLPGPTITSLTPAAASVVLGGGLTGYKALIDNPGVPQSGVVLQGWISQSGARRAAGGATITCNPFPNGTLPNGTCIALGNISASNDPIIGGTGTLVLGDATFELELKINGAIVDTKTAPITLVANTPSILSIDFASTTIAIEGGSSYNATLVNPTSSTLTGVGIQGWIVQGPTRSAAGGTNVACANGGLPPGNCVVNFVASVSNSNSSNGTIVTGPAQFVLELSVGSTIVDTKSVALTLTAPQ